MRVLVCGGRNFADAGLLNATLNDLHHQHGISLILHGNARGADHLADEWAFRHKVEIRRFPPDWKRYGNRAAGPVRNRQMLVEGLPDLVLAFPGGRGTKDMVDQARAAGKNLMVIGD